MKLKKPLPKGAVVGGIVAAGLLVALVGWKVVVSPQKHKAADLAAETAAVKQKITDQLSAVAAAKTVSDVPKIRVADVYKLAKAMPSTTDMPNILIELDQVARDAGVDLQQLSPSPPAADGTIALSLTVGGDFFTLTDLLYRLRSMVSVRHGALEATGRLFAIDGVSLSPTTDHAINAKVSLHTYTYAPPAPVAPAATPATTDTTQTTTTSPDTSSESPSATGAP